MPSLHLTNKVNLLHKKIHRRSERARVKKTSQTKQATMLTKVLR